MRRKVIGAALALGLVLTFLAEAHASPITVGTGVNTSMVLIEFSDGNLFEFAVSYDGGATGEDMLNLMDSETAFDFEGEFFDFGGGPKLFVYAMSFGGSSEGTFGDFATSPTYYVRRDAADPWGFSGLGVSDRVVSDGSFDGWTFSERVIPEPSTLAVLGLGAMLPRVRRGRGMS